MKEAQVEAYLVRRVFALGGLTAKMTIAGQRGWPDRLVVLPGRPVMLVELKKPKGGVLSPAQRRLIGRLAELGTHVWVLSSLEDVDKVFGK